MWDTSHGHDFSFPLIRNLVGLRKSFKVAANKTYSVQVNGNRIVGFRLAATHSGYWVKMIIRSVK